MKNEFDEIIDRTGTLSVKYDGRIWQFKTDDVLPLWVADMDFRCPGAVTDAILKRAAHGIYGYAYRPDSYYEAIADWLAVHYSWNVKASWMSFTPGVVTALCLAVQAFTDPGDRIIVQPPVYFPFFSAIRTNRRTIAYNPLKLEGGRYSIDFEDLEKKAAAGARMLMLSNPHNPVGRSWTREELETMSSLCRKYGLLILSDEIHCDLTLPGYVHVPMASLSDETALNTVTCIAASKTFNLAGLATSTIIIPDPVLKKRFDEVSDQVHIAGGNLFGTIATEAAYRNGNAWLKSLLNYLNGNLQFIEAYLDGHIPQVRMIRPEATYLVWLDCRKLGLDKAGLEEFMIRKAKIGLNNGADFGPGGEGFMRLNMACPRQVLEEALHRLGDAIKNRTR